MALAACRRRARIPPVQIQKPSVPDRGGIIGKGGSVALDLVRSYDYGPFDANIYSDLKIA